MGYMSVFVDESYNRHNDHDSRCGDECAYHIAAQNHTDAYMAVTPRKPSAPHTMSCTVR